ncbi:hypothetical protein SPONL_1058 [uncultured Candidatus Thioglobus sp.]|nr:hypothetical protein SPONL_1058 [uncultured Candidatus Thioglobus sp.]
MRSDVGICHLVMKLFIESVKSVTVMFTVVVAAPMALVAVMV